MFTPKSSCAASSAFATSPTAVFTLLGNDGGHLLTLNNLNPELCPFLAGQAAAIYRIDNMPDHG